MWKTQNRIFIDSKGTEAFSSLSTPSTTTTKYNIYLFTDREDLS